MEETLRIYGVREDLTLVNNREAAVEGADALVICAEWKKFRAVDFSWLKEQLGSPVVVDGRNIFDPSQVCDTSLLYYAVGRGESIKANETV